MNLRFQDRAICAATAAQFASALAMAASGALFPAVALAAVPVVESVAGEQRAVAPLLPQPVPGQGRPEVLEPAVVADQATVGAAGDARHLSELFYKLQVLQQEVKEVRGLLEEQDHRLNRIARDQQEQYIDLDRRVAALRNNASAPAISTSARAPTMPSSSGSGSERETYTDAFNLMKNRRFDESADAFNRLIIDYPNGQFTPNAFYWLGELYLAKAEHEMARQSFTQVANLYPDHQKVPDALYKLGVVYHRLGDTQRSLKYLGRVRAEHPQSSAASLAQTYAAELQ